MTDPTLSDILENSEKLFKKVQELSAENKMLREVLELYRGIPGRDCEKSTTKWSAADQVLAKVSKK